MVSSVLLLAFPLLLIIMHCPPDANARHSSKTRFFLFYSFTIRSLRLSRVTFGFLFSNIAFPHVLMSVHEEKPIFSMQSLKWLRKSEPANFVPYSALTMFALWPLSSDPNSGPSAVQYFIDIGACRNAFRISAAITFKPCSAAYIKAIQAVSLDKTPAYVGSAGLRVRDPFAINLALQVKSIFTSNIM